MYVSGCPTVTDWGMAATATDTSAPGGGVGGATSVAVTTARLFDGSGSGSLAVRSAVLRIVPAVVGRTTIVTVVEAPTPSVPRPATTWPVAGSKAPRLAETNWTPTGGVSRRVRPVAGL